MAGAGAAVDIASRPVGAGVAITIGIGCVATVDVIGNGCDTWGVLVVETAACDGFVVVAGVAATTTASSVVGYLATAHHVSFCFVFAVGGLMIAVSCDKTQQTLVAA